VTQARQKSGKMDFDDRTGTPRQPHNLAMEQTLTAPLNNTTDFLVIISFLVELILIRSFVRSFIRVVLATLAKRRLIMNRCSIANFVNVSYPLAIDRPESLDSSSLSL
jgi:hypothetical protein